MRLKAFSGIMLTLLLISMLTLAFNVQTAKASGTIGTIYIRADGSIEPLTANITSADNVTYTFTGNIFNYSIVVERDNIVVDGAGYTLEQPWDAPLGQRGISLSGRSNVIIMNVKIVQHGYASLGIKLYDSSNNTISGNNIRNQGYSIDLYASSNNTISGNKVASRRWGSIQLSGSSYNIISGNNITNGFTGILLKSGSSYNTISGNDITHNMLGVYPSSSNNNNISGNTITNNSFGVFLSSSSNNSVSGNTITNNGCGISLMHSSDYNTISGNDITNNMLGVRPWLSYNNRFYHNNFIDNTQQAYIIDSINIWDDGYPSGGNYWSDYTDEDLCSGPGQDESGSDGIWDHPYVIDSNNQDNYPLVHPWSSPTGHIYSLVRDVKSMGLRERVEDGLVGLLEDAVEFLEEDREFLATITIFRFTLSVQVYRWFGLLTKEQASHLTTEAMKIIHLI